MRISGVSTWWEMNGEIDEKDNIIKLFMEQETRVLYLSIYLSNDESIFLLTRIGATLSRR